MCGGNKGQSTQSTNQTQTYTPDAQARGYITGALDRAQQTANLPFNVPVAPVAGFSQDQLSAFNSVNNAQGMAQPYFNQAADLYRQGASGSNISNFFNPYAQAVTDNLKDIFGSQMSQTTGQLTQAAGGVGADRIAVGQSELAKQQGLAAGQTLASLYQPALQAAQSAAFNGAQGLGNVGMSAQNAALSGAQAQLGTGGLQQQLSQAQLNAPYQWQVAQAAFPYQQSQFLGSMVGALAPGLGGTTTGQSNTTSTPAQPSIWSQLLGGGAALAGGLGATGAFGSNGWLTGASQPGYGATYGGYGGSGSGFGSYGGISYPAFAKGGEVDDDPIDIAANPFIPKSQLTPIQPKIPQLQAPPQQGGGGGSTGKGAGDVIGSVAKVLPFFLARGGSVNPFAVGEGYAFGGSPTDEERELGYEMLRRGMGTRAPDTIPGGEAPPIVPVAPAEEPFRMPSEEAVQAWRDGADRDRALGLTKPVPDTVGAGPSQRPVSMDIPTETPMSYAPQDRLNTSGLPPEVISGRSKADVPQSPYGVPAAPQSEKTLADNPWMSLLAAGLGIMGGTSPFAGVNIGQGGMQGIKALQQQKENAQKDTTIAQAARRLEQEAKFHEDQYSRETIGQKNQRELARLPYEQMTAAQKAQIEQAERRLNKEEWAPAGSVETESGSHPLIMEKSSGKLLDAVTQKPPAEGDKTLAKGTKAPITDDDARSIAQRYIDTGNPAMLQGLGYSGSNRAKVNHFIDVIQKEQGISNQELATRTAEWEGRKAGQRVLAQQEAKMGSAAMEAEGAIKLSRGVIERLPRTQFLPLNKLIQGYSEKTLNPDQAELYARTQAIVNTYAAVMSRGASITSDTSRAHAMRLLDTANNPETFNRVLDTMLNEIDMAKHSPDRMRRFYRQHYGESAMGNEPPAVSNAPAGTAPAAKTIARQGKVNSGPNAGKTVIEYSDGTREYR